MRILSMVIASVLVFAANAETIKVGGGAAPINNIFRKVQEPFTKKTGIKLEISEEGPDLALKSVSEGKIHIASAGLAQHDWFKRWMKKSWL